MMADLRENGVAGEETTRSEKLRVVWQPAGGEAGGGESRRGRRKWSGGRGR